MSDWLKVTVEQIKAQSEAALATGPFGSSIGTKTFRETGVPIIRGGNLSADVGIRLIDEGLVFVDDDTAKNFRRSTVRDGDLIFTSWGTINQVGLIDVRARYKEYVISNKQMKLTPDRTRADSLFLYYLFSSPQLQSTILANGIGSSVPGFNLGQLRSMEINLPPPDEQRAIASILGALDDKIDLNRKMSATLEATARALFTSWFVDFDPVRAKSEGRETGLAPEIAALFPSGLIPSAIGDIPIKWTVSKLGGHLHTVLGGTPSRENRAFWDGGSVPWINSGKVNEFRIVTPSAYITDDALRRSAASLLPERTTVVAITGATLGQVSLLEISAAANQSVVGILGSVEIPSEFVYNWVRARIDDLVRRQTGGAQQHVNKNDVNDLPLLVPTQPVMKAFLRIARPMFDGITQACLENVTLAAVRDALLPKLISGDVHVPDDQRVKSST